MCVCFPGEEFYSSSHQGYAVGRSYKWAGGGEKMVEQQPLYTTGFFLLHWVFLKAM